MLKDWETKSYHKVDLQNKVTYFSGGSFTETVATAGGLGPALLRGGSYSVIGLVLSSGVTNASYVCNLLSHLIRAVKVQTRAIYR